MLHSIAAELDYVIILGETICDILNYCLDLLEADDKANPPPKTLQKSDYVPEYRGPDYDIMAPNNVTKQKETQQPKIAPEPEPVVHPAYIKFIENSKTHPTNTFHVLNPSVVSECNFIYRKLIIYIMVVSIFLTIFIGDTNYIEILGFSSD